jgi:hypothetical protein
VELDDVVHCEDGVVLHVFFRQQNLTL